jgi:signal transduction histidine kinase
MAKLRPRARIIRTIGDQLISGPEAALIELVKNAYDADAKTVRISILPPNHNSAFPCIDKIVVTDDGHGMSSDDLLDKWLEPATDDKLQRKISPGGRDMLGAKGVGRFASARLGKHLVLTTGWETPENKLSICEISINWQDFESNKYLDQVDVDILTKSASKSSKPGLTLEISELRDSWTSKQLADLVRELRRVLSPISSRENDSGKNSFRIFLDLSQITEETHGFDGQSLVSGSFRNPTTESADIDFDPQEILPFSLGHVFHYQLSGTFNLEGHFSGAFINARGDSRPIPIEIPSGVLSEEEMPCGSVGVRLNIFDREGDAVAELFEKLGLGSVGKLEAKRMLDQNIGIGIYRRGFRIRPYGDPESDWLALERRRVQDPSEKIGLNQVWGIINIDAETASGLIERSSREGLEHNGAFLRLKRLITGVLVHVEQRRLDFRQKAGLSRKRQGDLGEIRDRASFRETNRAVSELPPRYKDKVERALKKDSAALRIAIESIESYQQVLESRSALGLVVSQVLHDGRRFVSDITTRAKAIQDGASRVNEQSKFGDHYRSTLGKNSESIHNSAHSLRKLFKALDPISGRRRGKPKQFNPRVIIQQSFELMREEIERNDVSVILNDTGENSVVIGYEDDLAAALLNIIDNAIHWLGTRELPRILSIDITESKRYVRIGISNNGPTIDEGYVARLFEPGFTLKSEGTGIGLAIAREALRRSKGDLLYDEMAEQTKFIIEIQKPKKGEA